MTESIPRRGEPTLELSAGAITRNARALGLSDAPLPELFASGRYAALSGLDGGGDVAARLRGRVLSTKVLRAGEGVSYGYIYRAPSDTRVALVTGGYAQGICRSLGNDIDVASSHGAHRVVGRVAMDVCVVDIGEAPVERGDLLDYFGAPHEAPDVRKWAELTGLTLDEILASVWARAGWKVLA